MASPRFAWGIDVGNRALKAIKLVRDGDKLVVDDLEVIEHEQILSSAGDNRDSLIQTALANFVQRHSVKGGVVGISVSGQSSFARFIKLPPVEPRKIPEIVRFEAIQQIPFPLDDVEWSYQLFQSPDSPDVEVGIFAMRKELVAQNIKHFTDVHMDVQVVQMSPLAVYNAMNHDGRLDGTTMIVDLGAENTDLVIADGESVWLRTIPIGGNNFTEVLAKQFKLSGPKAEELKRNARTSKYARQIFQAMRPIFADLVAEIQRSIGFYASVHREAKIKRIIALGATFRLPTLMKYLQQNLQIDVEQIDALAGGAPADGRLATTLNENLISMVGAYGLAIQAMDAAKITSSLLPEPIRRAKIWREKTKWFATAAALIVLGTVGYGARWYNDNYNFEHNSALRSTDNKLEKDAKDLSSKWNILAGEGKADRQVIKNVNSMAQYLDLWPRLISDLRSALPAVPVNPMDLKAQQPLRTARNQVNIEDWTSVYHDKIGPMIDSKVSDDEFKQFASLGTIGSGMGPANPGRYGSAPVGPGAAAAPAIEERGFLWTLHGTTPNAGGATFLQGSIIKALQAMNASDSYNKGKPYYISRVSIVAAHQVGLGNPATPGFGAARFIPAQNGVGVPAPAVDSVTGEPIADDWDFRILVAVVMDPPAPAVVPTVVAQPAPIKKLR